MNYSYNDRIMTNDHGPHPRHSYVNEKGNNPQESGTHPRLKPFSSLVSEVQNLWQLSKRENHQERRWIPLVWKSTCLEQRAVESAIDDGRPLMRPTDHVNAISWPVDGRLLDWNTAYNYLQELFNTFLDPVCRPLASRAWRKLSMLWSSSRSGKCMLRNGERDTGSKNGRLVLRRNEISDSLAVFRIVLLRSVSICAIVCGC